MIKINVQIKGTTPLLQHRMATVLKRQKLQTKVEEDFEAMAEKCAYKMEDGTLYAPSTWIMGTLRDASKYFKQQKPPLRQVISGLVIVKPAEISLGTKEYEIDVRTAVNKSKGRINVARPRLNSWTLDFTMEFNPAIAPITADALKDILDMAGKVVGIGSYRPAHAGSFGLFEISKWEVTEA